jgi:hypothetical protein
MQPKASHRCQEILLCQLVPSVAGPLRVCLLICNSLSMPIMRIRELVGQMLQSREKTTTAALQRCYSSGTGS